MSLTALLTRILFVGHSLVGPDLPPMVEGALTAMGDPAQVQAQVINGAPLAYNWDHSAEAEGVDARAMLATEGTDVLILTEAQPFGPQVEWNDTAGRVAAFAGLARERNPETRVFLYETWPSLTTGTPQAAADDPGRAQPWGARIQAELPLWQGVADKAAAMAGPVTLIPAGQAMARLDREIAAGRVPGMTSIREAFSDDIHPNGKGLYLVAMVQAAAITGQPPDGLPAKLLRQWPSRDAVVPEDLAPVLQRIAWDTVQALPAPAKASAPPPVATLAPITNPNLAFGLAGVNDWSVEQPFLNVMKTARPWTGHLPGQWGGWDYDRIAAGGYLDDHGWPMAIPPGCSALATLVLTDLPPDTAGVAGRYVVKWQGRGVMKVEGRAQVVSEAAGRIVFDYTPGPGAVILTISVLDPADPIHDIVIVREDREAALEGGAIFNPDWLARIRGVRMVRFMDWMAVNDSTLSHLRDRPRPEDFTWGRNGVPMEIMVALANELDADPWFNIPHLAEDDLVRKMAEIARDGLKPGLRAWVEFSNEVWNWQFAQAHWAEEQGKARWGRDTTWVQFYALRAGQVMDIWRDTMADPVRLVRVVATQTGWLGLEDQILDAPLLRAEGDDPARHFDAYAVTGYFAALLGSDEKAPMVRGWLAQGEEKARVLAAQELRDGSVSGNDEDTLARLVGTVWPHHAKVAKAHGLRLVMYEGGTHVVGLGRQVDDPVLTDFFIRLNYSPEMGALYDELLAGWAQVSDAPFNAFVDVLTPAKWGSWGALRHLGDDSPRWQALARGCRC
ncbi:MAG: hypothetical protein QM656_11615 [Paracoccaceae bacterium]